MYNLFLTILNHSVWHKETPIEYDKVLPEHWGALCRLLQEQAMSGICFNSISYLPKNAQPPKQIYLKCAGIANYVKISNRKKLMVLSELYKMLEPIKVKPIVMKGLSVAINYPEPEMRLSGDIDLYIPEKYNEVISLIQSKGYETEYMERHYKFIFNDILIELHHRIINEPFKELNRYSAMENEYNNVRFLSFDVNTQAVLLITHAASHLVGPGIGFKHLCDWIMFLNKHESELDFDCFNKNIKIRHLETFLGVFSTVGYKLLHYPIPNKIKGKKGYLSECLTKDLLIQGDCGQSERQRRYKSNIVIYSYMYFKRLLKFLPYSPQITIKVLFIKIKELLKSKK